MPESKPVQTPHPHTFLTLDALRGIAALAVVCFHIQGILGHNLFRHAYLAVDFFFMLSGFVLSYAYDSRFNQGLTTMAFMKARLIRLYPLYILGTFAFFILTFVLIRHTGSAGSFQYLLALVPALLFIPAPPSIDPLHPDAFPYNPFAWSLFYELVANLLHATLFRRLHRSLPAIVLLSGILLSLILVQRGSVNFGTLTRDIPSGLARVIFSYTAGLWLFRLWSKLGHRRVSPFWSLLLLLVTLCVPAHLRGNTIFEIFAMFVLLPAIVMLGACSQPSGIFKPVATRLGTLSYGIYILSGPLGVYVRNVCVYILRKPAASLAPWSGLVLVLLLIGAAWAANFFYDIPLRRWLTRCLR
jgi:peptidoglycan/LPS O-acetylase OafA/YrhL